MHEILETNFSHLWILLLGEKHKRFGMAIGAHTHRAGIARPFLFLGTTLHNDHDLCNASLTLRCASVGWRCGERHPVGRTTVALVKVVNPGVWQLPARNCPYGDIYLTAIHAHKNGCPILRRTLNRLPFHHPTHSVHSPDSCMAASICSRRLVRWKSSSSSLVVCAVNK